MEVLSATSVEWLITMLAINGLLLWGIFWMYRGAPCWMQKISVGLLAIAAFGFVCAYIAALFRVDQWWSIIWIAFVFEHLAVIMYVFRIWWQRGDERWRESSGHSRHSPTSSRKAV